MRVDIRIDDAAVFLVPYGDGKRIDYAIAADEEAGTIWSYKRKENGGA